jgi:hypothetical protein
MNACNTRRLELCMCENVKMCECRDGETERDTERRRETGRVTDRQWRNQGTASHIRTLTAFFSGLNRFEQYTKTLNDESKDLKQTECVFDFQPD